MRWKRGFRAARGRGAREPADDRLAPLWSPLDAPAAAEAQTLQALLAPYAGLTSFHGRGTELAELLRWCTDPGEAPVQVLAGPAGVGKSRLAVELSHALPPGWTAGVARPGTTAEIVPAAAALGSVLVVVDNADTAPAADVRALLGHAASAQVRVLLVVRDAAAFAEHLQVTPGDTTTLQVTGDRRRAFADAVRGFLRLPDDARLPPWAEPEQGPVGVDEEPMAVTQTRAALAVLGADPDHALALRTADLDGLTDAILAHEQRRWGSEACVEGLLALLLRGVDGTADDAAATLRALPRFRGATDDRVRAVAMWAHGLYPGLDPQPGLVGAALLTLASQPRHSALVDLLDLPGGDPRVIVRLVRAADHPRVAALLATLFTGARLTSSVEATLLAGAPGLSLRSHVVAALNGRSLTAEEAGRLLPLAEAPMWSAVQVAVRRAAVRHLRRSTAADPRLPAALHGLSGCLRDLGSPAEALPAAREAVERYRDVTAIDPGYTADLAAALTDLGRCLRETGAPAEALAACRETVLLYRALDPARHGPDLARALLLLGADLREAGSPTDALAAAREAVERYRGLAADGPAQHHPDLAAALTVLGACLREGGTPEEALAVTREAVQLYRDVAGGADCSAASLARAVTDLATDLRHTGASGEALPAAREAVRRCRALVAADPARHGADLARALTVLAAVLREAGSTTAGRAAAREAVERYEALAAADPARHVPDLARALTHLGAIQRGLAADHGLAPASEAVRLYRELAAADPARHTPGLARALTHLGISLRGCAAHEEALSAAGEAVELQRALAAANPARHTADLTRSLIGLGAGLRALGRRTEAALHEADAVAWWWHLTQQRPGEFDEQYREAQRRYFRTFSPYDHDPSDLMTAELVARGRVRAYLGDDGPQP